MNKKFTIFLKSFSLKKIVLTQLACLSALISMAQYVSPNQPGRAGGNTQPSDPSLNTVVTSTYYGTDGTLTGQGSLVGTDKNPAVGSLGSNTRVLHYFKGFPADASYSWYTTPFTASDGNMYGSSYYGGANNWGAVYKYQVDSAQSGSCVGNTDVIYSMGGTGAASYGNFANVNELSDGKIYIPETAGGSCVYGKITKTDKDGSNPVTVHNFCGFVNGVNVSQYSAGAQAQPGFSTWSPFYAWDGVYPYGFQTEGPDGYVYGTTLWGGLGAAAVGYGTVYKMQKDGSDYKILAYSSTLSVGTYNTADGGTVANIMPFAVPWGNVAFDQAGVYAYFFGGYINGTTYGNICRVKIDGSAPVELVHKFTYTGNANDPYYLYRGPIIVDNELFGTTYYGGAGAYGTVFKIDLSKLNATDNPIDANGVNNTLQVLHGFSFNDGAYPFAGLVYDGTYLYGSTQQGGYTGTSYGTIYKIKPDGTGFQTILDLKNEANTCPVGTPADQQSYYVYYPGSERVTFANLTPSTLTCFDCIKNKCNIGTAMPNIPATAGNVCPATTVDLATLVDANNATMPAGSKVVWSMFNNPNKDSLLLTNLMVSTAGTYYACYKDTVNGCFGACDSITVTITPCVVADSVYCDKLVISAAPVAGVVSQHDLIITLSAATVGCKNISVSGSGLSLANGVTQVCLTATGVQTVHVPVNYDGTALGTAMVNITGINTCTIDLAAPNNVKKAIIDIWTIDNCNVKQAGPAVK
jgi:uncharacterized repeat protein (TIGR03803 family)